MQLVLAQEEVKGEHVIEAALRLIQGEGRVVTLDAGLNQREIADAIVKKGGAYLGVVITPDCGRYCCKTSLLGRAYHSSRGIGDMGELRIGSIGG